GLHGEALERYREARTVDAARTDAHLGEVKALLAMQRFDEARGLTEELLQLAPEDVEALVAAARARAAAGDAAGALTALQDAQRAYEQALDQLPTFHEAALALADLLRRTGRARAAIIRLADQLEQDPYDLDALLLLGRALLDDKRTDASVEAFRRVLKFDPEHMGALFHLGVALARVHRYAEAVEAWEKVTRLDPGGPFAQRARMHARTALDLQHIFASDAA